MVGFKIKGRGDKGLLPVFAVRERKVANRSKYLPGGVAPVRA